MYRHTRKSGLHSGFDRATYHPFPRNVVGGDHPYARLNLPGNKGDEALANFRKDHKCKTVCVRLGINNLSPYTPDDERPPHTISNLLTMAQRNDKDMFLEELNDSGESVPTEYLGMNDNDWNVPFGMA